jgi:uncharacterized membrane protein YfcA
MVGRGWAYPAGLTGGVASAMFGAGAPPYVVYLSMRPLAKAQMRATLVLTSMFSIGTRVIAFAWAGLLASTTVWITALAVLPAALLALWWAERVHASISRETLIRYIQLLLLAAGVSLIVHAAGGG